MSITAEWHARCNELTAAREAARMGQFGLKPSSAGERWWPGSAAVGDIWAVQGRGASRPDRSSRPVRVGFAGSRLHVGHLGLARAASRLVTAPGRILVFDGSRDGAMLAGFVSALRWFGADGADVHVVAADDPDLRKLERESLSAVRLGEARRLYGWDLGSSLGLTSDVATMLSFFLHAPEEGDRGGLALVDVLQAPHGALLPRCARRLGRSEPLLLHRRLFPHLRRESARGTAREPASVVFVDDDPRTLRRKFLGARTGGRPTAAEQRERGGDPTGCAAFALIELTCPEPTAAAALRHCHDGAVTCTECKAGHVEAVTTGVREMAGPELRADISPRVRQSIARTVPTLHRPPARTVSDLEAAVAHATGVLPGQVVVGNGSTEVLDWVFRGTAEKGGQVVATEPTFELYRDLALRYDLQYVAVPWNQRRFDHDLTAVVQAFDDQVALCVLDVPHSISGVATPVGEVLAHVLPRLPTQATLIIDLAYGSFMHLPPTPSELGLEKDPRVVVLGTLSKAHCILGARVGYGLAASERAGRLRRFQLPYGMGSLTLAAADGALRDSETPRRNVEASHRARRIVTSALTELGLEFAPSEANFILFNLGPLHERVSRALAERRIRFRDGNRWGLSGWLQLHLIDPPSVRPAVDVIRDAATRHNARQTER